MDGFIVRRRAPVTNRRVGIDDLRVSKEFLISPAQQAQRSVSSHPSVQKITDDMSTVQSMQVAGQPRRHSSGVDMTLDGLDIPTKAKGRKGFRLRRPPRHLVRLVVILLLVTGLAYGGFFAWKILSNGGKIFNGNPFAALFAGKPLKADQYGRTNVLLFGTSEDDAADGPNGSHPGAYLTDSIMIASFSQKDKNAYLLSVPRDLWINYGQQCYNGYQGKINAYYLCASGSKDGSTPGNEARGQRGLADMIGRIFGIDLQYTVHVDYTALKQSVDAVGGITVNISSDDPMGVLDRNFDWTCPGRPYSCYLVKWPNGPAKLDGTHALYLARARGDDNGQATYGFSGGNFDREKYQREIFIALKDKATSIGTLANPVAVTNLLDSLGNNVRTNINSDEVRSFIDMAKSIDAKNITSLTLVDPKTPLVTNGMIGDQSVVEPIAGIYDYSGLQKYVKTYISGDKVAQEAADITVLNSSGVAGVASNEASTLESKGLSIATIDVAPTGIVNSPVVLYDQSGGKKPATLQKLEQVLGIKATTATLPSSVTSSSDFVIIVGRNGAN